MSKKVIIITLSVFICISIFGWFGYQMIKNRLMNAGQTATKSENHESQPAENMRPQYEEAVQKFRDQKYAESKALCLDIMQKKPNARVYYDKSSSFKIGPAILDLLGRIYTQENDTENALKCYQRMIDQFPNDSYPGPFEGESSFEGISGAEGLANQINIYVKMQDYETALQLNLLLNKKYGAMWMSCWEGGGSYGSISAQKLDWILNENAASFEKRAAEYRKLMDISTDKPTSAYLLFDLARRYSGNNDFVKAEQLYNELITKYGYEYGGIEIEGYEFYSLDACLNLIEIYQTQNEAQEKIDQIKMKMREIIEKITKPFEKENGYNPFGDDNQYVRFLNGDDGSIE